MQANFIDESQVAEVLADATILAQLEGPGASTTYVLEYVGQDVLMFVDGAIGQACVVYPSSSFDQELGGSIHDEARRTLADADVGAR